MKGSIDPQNLSEFRVKVLLESGKLRELPLNKGFYPLSIYFYANSRLTELTKQLAINISAEQKENPLKAPQIVVPNPNLIPWLRQQLPKVSNRNVTANLQFTFLEKAILQKIGDASLSEPYSDQNFKLLSNEEEHQKLFEYLYTNQKDLAEEFPFIETYLEQISGIYYLAEVFLKYFKDYELNRSGWIFEWAKEVGIHYDSPIQKTKIPDALFEDPYYLLQKKVYQKLLLNKTKQNSLYSLLHESRKSKLQGNLHLFCLSSLSGTFIEYFKEMANKSDSQFDIYLYQFHSGKVSPNTNDTKKLNLQKFAKPQNYLTEIFGKKHKPSGEPNSNTKLGVLKALANGAVITNDLLLDNESLRVWNAPSTYREVEAIANDILSKIAKSNGTLSFLDFAILVPNMKEYRSAIEWTFDGGILLSPKEGETPKLTKIPYSLTDIPSAETSALYKILAILFRSFFNHRFEKSDLRQLFSSSHITGITDGETTEEILLILDALGVRYEEEGNKTVYSMSTALDRVVLSLFVDEKTAWEEFQEVVPQLKSQSSILKFAEIWTKIQKLQSELRSLAIVENKDYDHFVLAFREFFILSDSDEEEERIFSKWLSSIEPWLNVLWRDEKHFLEALSFHTDSVFGGLKLTKGNYLSSGVTVSLLQPMRPIPFRNIYILGLGEGKFPGSNDQSKLNLRRITPEPWDLTKKEIQESLLWETIQSAEESLTLSYVGKNTKEDKEFEPCSSLFEIMTAMGIQKGDTIPLHPYSIDYSGSKIPSFDYTRNLSFVSDSNPKTSKERPKFTNPVEISSTPKEDHEEIFYPRQLRSLFLNPMKYRIQSEMGLYIDESEEEEETEEQFQLDNLERYSFKEKILGEICESLRPGSAWNWDQNSLKELVTVFAEREKKSARFSFGGYSVLSQNELLVELDAAVSTLKTVKDRIISEDPNTTYHKTVTYGDTGVRDAKKIEPTYHLDLYPQIRLFGEWNYVLESKNSFFQIQLSSIPKEPKSYNTFTKYFDKYFSKMAGHYISACILKLSGYDFQILSLPKAKSKKPGNDCLQFKNLNLESAKRYLQSLLELAKDEAYLYYPQIAIQDFFAEYRNNSETSPILEARDIPQIAKDLSVYFEENKDTYFPLEDKLIKLSPHYTANQSSINFERIVPLYLPLLLDVQFI